MSSDATTESNGDVTEVHEQHRAFGRAYWMLNSIEMFERLAYFGIRAVVPLYIMQATEPGGLHLTAVHKGTIYAWWAVFQSFLPIVTGGIADRYGFKRVLFFSILANITGYVMMANFHSYWGFFAGIIVLATGTAFFKPSLQGSLAQSLTKENSSLGWGIFYWVVNIGAFGAPIVATLILGKPHSAEGWRTLFYACACFTACNLPLLLTFKDVPSGSSKTESPWQVIKHTVVNVLEPRLVTWLLIMSCFWLMMYQLWDLHPNFITDWVDSSAVAAHAPQMWQEYGDRGLIQVPQQILLNLNAGLIILLIVPLSWAARKMRTLSAMLVGMSVATCGVLIAGLTDSGWILLLGIVFFSLGEMWTGPKKNEYLGLIAPPGKKGLYLGYVNIPIGIGVFVGSYMAGFVYDNYGEKATLALKELAARPELVARAAQSIDWSDSLEKLPALLDIERDQAFALAQQHLGQDTETAAETLQTKFKYDEGQIVNLGYLFLASDPKFAEKARAGLEDEHELHGANIAAAPEPTPADYPNYVHRLPDWIDTKRVEVWEVLRELVAAADFDSDRVQDTAIIDMLWERFGGEPAVLNNLALEYLAQGTPLLGLVIQGVTLADPFTEIQEKFGIGRTKSFAALSAAIGADASAVDAALDDLDMPEADRDDRLFALLATRPHLVFTATARRNWTNDVSLLREMIESDADAKTIVERDVWEPNGVLEVAKSIFGYVPPRQDMYGRLAENQDLIQRAFGWKDWSQTPDQTVRLFRLNPFEARSLAAAEVNQASLTATKLLWDTYDPQYKVWLPFAAIGVLATIALAIFGQMAKRWKDMNA